MAKLKLYTDGYEAFKERAINHACTLDRSGALPSESSITFSSVRDLLKVLTPKRIALLEALILSGERPVTLLAKDLRRTPEAVTRDIHALCKLGILSTASAPGHGLSKVLTVKPSASRLELICSIDSGKNHPVAA